MMTTDAFNFCKQLKPPSFCIFVLATTEPHKIPSTIISRCQRFDFKNLVKSHSKNLEQICEKLIAPKKQTFNSDLAEGGMRCLSILDQYANSK